jgi:glycosyltransferase involved in cell wall biosynthesis
MKVVILHDWLTGFRGGERVLESFCEMYPDAPIYTLIYKKNSTTSTIIESREIITSFLDRIPGIYENYRYFLPLMPLAAYFLKIKHDADLVISSSHCVIKGVKKPKGSKHICYIHSPMRYIYDQFNNYFGNSSPPIKMMAIFIRPFLKWYDKQSNKNVDLFLANSHFVKDRIDRYYQEDARVIHPFVDLKDFREVQKNPLKKEDFYLMVTAFAPNKKVDLAIDAFNELGHSLKIIGSGSVEMTAQLETMANKNIEFLGVCERSDVIDYMARAKGFIFPGIEDFGITPLEVLASGTPIIAFKAGGVLETLNDNTATFFTELTKERLIEAISKNELKTRSDLLNQAELFSKEVFQMKVTKEIKITLPFISG